MNWKFFIGLAIPFVLQGAEYYKNKDANTTGKDDMIGLALEYVAQVLSAAMSDKNVPKPPDALIKGSV